MMQHAVSFRQVWVVGLRSFGPCVHRFRCQLRFTHGTITACWSNAPLLPPLLLAVIKLLQRAPAGPHSSLLSTKAAVQPRAAKRRHASVLGHNWPNWVVRLCQL
jgi:hypothetical protein